MLKRASRWCGSVLALATLLACSGSSDTFFETHAFNDAAGRACQATLEKTSQSAPSLSQSVSCDGDGKQCSSESQPCFQLSVDDTTSAVRNCPACCEGTASSYTSADCSALACATDADCVYARAVCEDGACVCPNGICE